MSSAKYMYEMILQLTPLEMILAFTGFALLTMTVVFTILDYTSKAKHINKKEW